MWHTVCNGGDGLTLDLADGGRKTETNDLDGVTMPTAHTRTYVAAIAREVHLILQYKTLSLRGGYTLISFPFQTSALARCLLV